MNRDTQLAICTAPKRDSLHWKNDVTTWGDIIDWMATPGSRKEAGNYVLGSLKPTQRDHPEAAGCFKVHRTKDAVVTRSALTLDLDHGNAGLPDVLDLTLDHAALMHTTFSSTEEAPRYRLIIPLNREVKPDEYVALAGHVMHVVGWDLFDPGSLQPERYMFKPAAPDLDSFRWWLYDGPAADADALLTEAEFDPDLSGQAMPSLPKGKRNPFEIDGVVGAFNRAYSDFQLLITEYDLPYAPAGANRWSLVGASGAAGMGVVTDGIVYSHHANDPAYGEACTAFDLVRLHRFGELDEGQPRQQPVNRRPSYDAMLDLATVDARVTAELVGVDFAEDLDAAAQSNDWRLQLSQHMNRQGRLKDTADAWGLVMDNDPVIQSLGYNEMTFATEVTKDLPWRPLAKGGNVFTGKDRLSLQAYLEKEYRTQPTARRVDWMVDETAMRRYHNPVRAWLKALEWDGVERLETCLPGVEINDYTRMVARKNLVAAVARMMEPGCKWDHTMILFGKEGLGKTWWIERMSRGWTAPLGAVGNKDTLINLQRCWIATSDEGASMRKADAEALKEFLTRRTDVFRMPYEREATSHPRHCVIWGTTNDEVFLRQQEGNRRFLIVRCEKQVDFSVFTDYYVDQIWAEAAHYYRQGEVLLWLNPEESEMAAAHRESFIEEGTAVEGPIAAFLNTKVPLDWWARSVESRQAWLRDRADGLEGEGEMLLPQVCSMQMHTEALGRLPGTHNRLDLLEYGKALRGLGWTLEPGGKVWFGSYGPQVAFNRPAGDGDFSDEDLL